MTVPKMAKKTGGMAPKRKMKGGEPETIKVGDQEYTVTVEGSKVCVEPKDAPAENTGEEKSDDAADANANANPTAAAAPVDGAEEASFGGKKGKKRTQKKKGKKPRKSAKKAKK